MTQTSEELADPSIPLPYYEESCSQKEDAALNEDDANLQSTTVDNSMTQTSEESADPSIPLAYYEESCEPFGL